MLSVVFTTRHIFMYWDWYKTKKRSTDRKVNTGLSLVLHYKRWLFHCCRYILFCYTVLILHSVHTVSISCLSKLKRNSFSFSPEVSFCFWGFFLTWLKALRTEGIAQCTYCKALWGKFVICDWNWVVWTKLSWLVMSVLITFDSSIWA